MSVRTEHLDCGDTTTDRGHRRHKKQKVLTRDSLLPSNIFINLVFIQFSFYIRHLKRRKGLILSRTNTQSNPECQSAVKIQFPFVMIFARVPCAEHVI